MGETNSKPQPNHDFLRVFQREYKEIGEENDTRLGGVKVYQGPQGNLVAVKMSLAYQKEDVENFMDKNLPSLLNIQTRYLMKVLSYKTHAEDSMCGSVNGITTYHEYYQNTVQDELVRRKQVSLFYTEQELWAILYSIVSAAYYAEKYGLKPLSDIRPSTVYFTLKGEVKIMPFGIYPEDIGGYHKCFHQSEQTYLSPEQMDLMRERVTRSEVDQFKSDIYSIGVTLLSCATLQTAPTWYNYNDCVIDFNYINGLLQFAQNQNSDFFYKIIRIMLSEKVEDRPTATTIYRCLQPFEKEILALKPFNPDKEVIKKSIEQENKHSTELHTQGDKLFAEETPLPQGNQPGANSIIISVPFQGDDGKLYYQQTPQQQFEYLIQQSDGQPIPQLENQFFYHDQVQQVQYQQPQQQQPSAPVYVVNEPVNQSGVYVSYSQPGAQQVPQQVEYVYPNTAVSGVQYVQQTAQPQVILNGARQQYSQVLTQPPVQYQQVYQENNSAPLGAASQLILNPTPQPNVQYVQTTSSPYHPGQSQIIAQYSYNIEEKPFLSTQQPQGAYPPTGAEITNSHVQINPMVYGNTLQPVAQQEEQVKKAMRQPQSDQQMVNQDIYSNQIYNNAPSYQVNYNATHEPESPIGMVSHNQQNADINSSAAFQLGGYRTDAVSNSNAGLNPNVNANNNYTVTNQYYTSNNNNNNNNNSNDLMNDMNRRITEALQRTQTVLSNNNTTNVNHY